MVYSVSEDGFLSSAAPAPAPAPAGAVGTQPAYNLSAGQAQSSNNTNNNKNMLVISPLVSSSVAASSRIRLPMSSSTSSSGDAARRPLSSTTSSSRYGFKAGEGATTATTSPAAMATSSLQHDRITVACRVKPREAGRGVACASVGVDEKTVAWAGERAEGANARHFTFDYAAGERVGQEELFEKVRR